MVMLTLTRDNLDQVIPLAELLRGKADRFFLTASPRSVKGLGSSARRRTSRLPRGLPGGRLRQSHYGLEGRAHQPPAFSSTIPVFGGCAGYGCGAARQLSAASPIAATPAANCLPGSHRPNQPARNLRAKPARRYRAGTSACRECPIRPVCGGCLAVTYGWAWISFERDPYCFMVR